MNSWFHFKPSVFGSLVPVPPFFKYGETFHPKKVPPCGQQVTAFNSCRVRHFTSLWLKGRSMRSNKAPTSCSQYSKTRNTLPACLNRRFEFASIGWFCPFFGSAGVMCQNVKICLNKKTDMFVTEVSIFFLGHHFLEKIWKWHHFVGQYICRIFNHKRHKWVRCVYVYVYIYIYIWYIMI